jgi:hypothetical protein
MSIAATGIRPNVATLRNLEMKAAVCRDIRILYMQALQHTFYLKHNNKLVCSFNRLTIFTIGIKLMRLEDIPKV